MRKFFIFNQLHHLAIVDQLHRAEIVIPILYGILWKASFSSRIGCISRFLGENAIFYRRMLEIYIYMYLKCAIAQLNNFFSRQLQDVQDMPWHCPWYIPDTYHMSYIHWGHFKQFSLCLRLVLIVLTLSRMCHPHFSDSLAPNRTYSRFPNCVSVKSCSYFTLSPTCHRCVIDMSPHTTKTS